MGRIDVAPRRLAAIAVFATVLILSLNSSASAHDPRVFPPKSVPEAWDVLRQCGDNIRDLLDTNQLKEIPTQVAYCTPANEVLSAHAAESADPEVLRNVLADFYQAGVDLIYATREKTDAKTASETHYAKWLAIRAGIASRYKSDVLNASVYVCPMHPADMHLGADDRCTQCGMKLIRRRISSSESYQAPGKPSMTLTITPDRPLHPGRPAALKMKLVRRDGVPVRESDLVLMHTKKIHLLIVDRSLADYHHEHPLPTDTAGEYTFAFTPRLPGPYRVFADVVPAATSVQEYVMTDIPGEDAPGVIEDRTTRLSSTVDGYKFDLQFFGPAMPNGQLEASDAVNGRVTITGPDGKPFLALEPVMGSFAHVVGFNEDGTTVLHIHPMGQEPKKAEERAGPLFQFKFYAPVAGYYKLYAQVSIDGRQRFAPFALSVSPSNKPAGGPTTAPATQAAGAAR